MKIKYKPRLNTMRLRYLKEMGKLGWKDMFLKKHGKMFHCVTSIAVIFFPVTSQYSKARMTIVHSFFGLTMTNGITRVIHKKEVIATCLHILPQKNNKWFWPAGLLVSCWLSGIRSAVSLVLSHAESSGTISVLKYLPIFFFHFHN